MAGARGLYQKVPGGVWMVRRQVPVDVRERLPEKHRGKTWFVESTQAYSHAEAKNRAVDIQRRWESLVKGARALGTGPIVSLTGLLAGIEAWRRDVCAQAAGLPADRTMVPGPIKVSRTTLLDLSRPFSVAGNRPPPPPPPALSSHAAAWGRRYFDDHPDQSRSPELPHRVGDLIGRLQVAARDRDGWGAILQFDEALDAVHSAAVVLGHTGAGGVEWGWDGLPIHGEALAASVEAAGCVPTITLHAREQARQPFAAAWLEVVQHLEAERRRAALFLSTLESVDAPPSAIRVKMASAPYEPREGDKTIGEVVTLYRAERESRYGVADTAQKYGHLFRALLQAAGAGKPMRSLTRDDARAIRDLIARVPANAAKLYPGKSLEEAAELGGAEMAANLEAIKVAEAGGRAFKPRRTVKSIAPNTLRSYMVNLSAVCRWAVENGYAENNPVVGLIAERQNNVKRRAFTKAELERVFGALQAEREANSARYWVPAVLTFSGARANEIAQLQTADVKDADGVPYLDLTWFDGEGVRSDDKRLKNSASERALPLHPELIAAGFLEFVAQRREAGEARLFPELKKSRTLTYTHELSKWWGRHLNSVGLREPALTLHSLRHNFRQDAKSRPALLSEEVINGLGGWAAKGEGAKYGDRNSVAMVGENAAHLAKVQIAGGFKLAAVGAGALDTT